MAGESCDITEDLYLSAEAPGPVVEPLVGNADTASMVAGLQPKSNGRATSNVEPFTGDDSDDVSIVEDVRSENERRPTSNNEPYSVESLRRHDADRSRLLPWIFLLIAGIVAAAVALSIVFARDFDDVSGTITLLFTIAGTLIGGLVGHYFNK